MLKIIMMPSNQQKSVDQLSQIFCKIYEILNKDGKGDLDVYTYVIYQKHMETAFRMT